MPRYKVTREVVEWVGVSAENPEEAEKKAAELNLLDFDRDIKATEVEEVPLTNAQAFAIRLDEILSEHDGVCLDNEDEVVELTNALLNGLREFVK